MRPLRAGEWAGIDGLELNCVDTSDGQSTRSNSQIVYYYLDIFKVSF